MTFPLKISACISFEADDVQAEIVLFLYNNSDYLKKARKSGQITG